jgi:hypothetical protein
MNKNKRITTEQALSTVFAYHSNPNYGNIPDDEIDQATLFLAKYVKALTSEILLTLKGVPFDKVTRGNKRIYEAWALRVGETVDMRCEDRANERKTPR